MDRRRFLNLAREHAEPAVGDVMVPRALASTSLAPWSPKAGEWNIHTANHLYRRAGFGATLSELNAALLKTPGEVVDNLFKDPAVPAPPKYSDEWMDKTPLVGGTFQEQQAQQQRYYYANLAIRRWWGKQMGATDTMLIQKMTYFWMNHFVVESQKVFFPQMMYRYLAYFMQNPWGDFKQMVKDVTVQSAMLYYLDGAYSYRGRPNENYARELMELFTMGVSDKDGNPNYTETDIHEVAKALTGFGFDTTIPGLPATYTVANHDSSVKQPFANFGVPKKQYGLYNSLSSQYVNAGDDVLDAIFTARGDKIAYFICGKLYQFFVYHNIEGAQEKAIVTDLATEFQKDWSIKNVLTRLLKSEHFFDEGNVGAELKSPYEFLVGMARQLDIDIDEYSGGSVWWFALTQDQQLLDPPNVKGWPGYRSWISTTTLPNRNLMATALTVAKSLGYDYQTGYNSEVFAPLKFDDAHVTQWAKQFTNYNGAFAAFISEVANFLCAIKPSDALLQARIVSKFPPNYEWATLSDAEKGGATRIIIDQIMLLAQYQLC